MDIGGWLRSLGLEQYEAAFHANAVDADVLRDLTDQDLEKLGVLLGHRRKLLRAIAVLDGALAPASAPRPTPLPIEAILAVAAPTDPSQRAVAKFDDVALLVSLDELVKRTARPERPGCGSRAKDEA
jgi:hypothetical protein